MNDELANLLNLLSFEEKIEENDLYIYAMKSLTPQELQLHPILLEVYERLNLEFEIR